jgi:hypothetical protein
MFNSLNLLKVFLSKVFQVLPKYIFHQSRFKPVCLFLSNIIANFDPSELENVVLGWIFCFI